MCVSLLDENGLNVPRNIRMVEYTRMRDLKMLVSGFEGGGRGHKPRNAGDL